MRKIKYLILAIIIFLFCQRVSSTTNSNDSLLLILHTTDQPSEKITILNLLSQSYFKTDPSKSFSYAEQALFIAESIDNLIGKAKAKYNMSRYFYRKQEYQQAINLLLEAKESFSEIDENYWYANICLELGKTYQKVFEYEKSLNALYNAMEIYKDLNKELKLAECYNLIGGSYYDEEKYDKAFEYFQQSLTLWEKFGSQAGLATRYNNIGEIYRIRGIFDKAINYYIKSVIINKKVNSEVNLTINYENIGNAYLELGNFDTALFYLNKSLDISQKLKDDERISSTCISLGNYHLKRNDPKKALKHFIASYSISNKNKYQITKRDAADGLSKIYQEKRQYKDALFYLKKYKQINDSIYNVKNSEKITQLEMKLIFEHEKEINTLKRQNSTIRFFLFALGLVFLIAIIILLYGRSKIKTKHSKIKAQNLLLEKKQLNEEIDLKNRELTTNVMYLVKKNEFINFISEKLISIKQRFKKENQEIIEEIIYDLQSSMDTDIWKDFEERFRDVHEDFYKQLIQRFPKLTENEKKLSALLRLNMTTKEVAAITHQNTNTIEVARTRLRKKLGLAKKDISLVSFLSNL